MAGDGVRDMPISLDGASRAVPNNVRGGPRVQAVAAPPRRGASSYLTNVNRVAPPWCFVKHTLIRDR